MHFLFMKKTASNENQIVQSLAPAAVSVFTQSGVFSRGLASVYTNLANGLTFGCN